MIRALGRKIAGIAVFIGIVAFGSGSALAVCSNIPHTRPGEIYMLRGLANIFSLGLDSMQKELNGLGIPSCVFNHHRWKRLVEEIKERAASDDVSYPIIIIGHSLGADDAPEMATTLGRAGIPVRLVYMLDPVKPTRVGKNVAEIYNYYIYKPDKDKILTPDPDFKGKLENINVASEGVDHFDIEKDPRGHRLIIKRILEVIAAQEKINAKKGKKKK